MKIVIIDNYDSFTYNLSHLVKELGAEVTVLRNDQFALADLKPFDKIILSPGPGIPSEAGLLCDVIRTYAGQKPILGVCLGHQAIGEVFGARLENLSEVFHGVATPCSVCTSPLANASPKGEADVSASGSVCTSPLANGSLKGEADVSASGSVCIGTADTLFRGLPPTITVGRYHSWVVSKNGFPDCLEVTAESDEGQIMALRHRRFDIHGIQFHPESVLTPDGRTILHNFLNA